MAANVSFVWEVGQRWVAWHIDYGPTTVETYEDAVWYCLNHFDHNNTLTIIKSSPGARAPFTMVKFGPYKGKITWKQ